MTKLILISIHVKNNMEKASQNNKNIVWEQKCAGMRLSLLSTCANLGSCAYKRDTKKYYSSAKRRIFTYRRML